MFYLSPLLSIPFSRMVLCLDIGFQLWKKKMEWFEVVTSHHEVRQQAKTLFRSTSVACDDTTT